MKDISVTTGVQGVVLSPQSQQCKGVVVNANQHRCVTLTVTCTVYK